MKETEALEVMMAYLEGAIQQLEAYQHNQPVALQSEYDDGRINALTDALEEAVFIKVSYLKSNSK